MIEVPPRSLLLSSALFTLPACADDPANDAPLDAHFAARDAQVDGGEAPLDAGVDAGKALSCFDAFITFQRAQQDDPTLAALATCTVDAQCAFRVATFTCRDHGPLSTCALGVRADAVAVADTRSTTLASELCSKTEVICEYEVGLAPCRSLRPLRCLQGKCVTEFGDGGF